MRCSATVRLQHMERFRGGLFDLNQIARRGSRRLPRNCLRSAPEIHVRGVVHARHRTAGRAGFLGDKLAPYVVDRVFIERLSGVAALLRAVMHQPVLAYIEVAGAGPAAPVVLPAVRDIILEKIQLPVAAAAEFLRLEIDGALVLSQRTKLAVAIMDDPDCRGKSQFNGTPADCQGVLGIVNPAAASPT